MSDPIRTSRLLLQYLDHSQDAIMAAAASIQHQQQQQNPTNSHLASAADSGGSSVGAMTHLPPLSVHGILISILIQATQYFDSSIGGSTNSFNQRANSGSGTTTTDNVGKVPSDSDANLESDFNQRLFFIQHIIHSSSQNLSNNASILHQIRHNIADIPLYRFILNQIDNIYTIEHIFELMEKNHELLFDRRDVEDEEQQEGIVHEGVIGIGTQPIVNVQHDEPDGGEEEQQHFQQPPLQQQQQQPEEEEELDWISSAAARGAEQAMQDAQSSHAAESSSSSTTAPLQQQHHQNITQTQQQQQPFSTLESNNNNPQFPSPSPQQHKIFRIEQESFFGLILRKLVIQFEEMMFDEVAQLFDNWMNFKKDLVQELESYSEDEIESFIHHLHLSEDFEHLNELEQKFPHLPKVQYLKYLRAMKQKNWQEALDSLHRYFDYCHIVNIGSNPQHTPTADSLYENAQQSMIASYAGLNLAALYFHFGYYESAVYAIKETIRIAQQKGEEECLSLSLAWLFRLENKNPNTPGSSQETMKLVQKCIERCRHLNLPHLLAETLLFSAQLMTSKEISPRQMGDAESPMIPALRTDDDSDSILLGTGLPASIDQSVREAKQVIADSNLSASLSSSAESTQAATWKTFGYKELSKMHQDVESNCIQESLEEAVLGNHSTQGESAPTAPYTFTESKLMHMVHRAHEYADQGAYSEALKTLMLFPGDVSIHVFWYRNVYDIIFDYSLRRNETSKARSILHLMKRIAPSEDFEYRTMIMWREAKLELSLDNAQRASQIIQQALQLCKRGKFDTQLARLLHMDASIEIQCKSPLKSLNPIMEGITLCEKRSLILLLCEFKMLLAEVYLIRDQIVEAHDVLEDIFPHVLENGSSELVGHLFLLAARVWSENHLNLLQQAYEHFDSVQYYRGMMQCLQMKHRKLPQQFTSEDENQVLRLHSTLHYNSNNNEVFRFGNSADASEVLGIELENLMGTERKQ